MFTYEWRKSSYSAGQSACVEVADGHEASALRDTQNRDLGMLAFPNPEWHAFLRTAKR